MQAIGNGSRFARAASAATKAADTDDGFRRPGEHTYGRGFPGAHSNNMMEGCSIVN